MFKNKILRYLLAVLLLLMAVAFYVYREYNRKAPDTVNLKAAYQLPAVELIADFQTSETDANAKYLGKILAVTGMVKSVDSDSSGTQTLVIGDTASLSSIRCTMNTNAPEQGVRYQTGTTVTIKGFCTGFNADDMGLGADVLLNRCVSQNQVKP